jgi:hypothetical protein
MAPVKKSCFIIGPIGSPSTEVWKKADQVVRHLIVPALATLDHYAEPLRADMLGTPGMITRQIVDHVIDDDLVIADRATFNPNVFYELAVRHAFQKPVVQLRPLGEPLPFDVKDMRTVNYDLADPDVLEEARSELRKHIEALEAAKEPMETPISRALERRELAASEDIVQRTLAEIQDQMSALQSVVSELANPRFVSVGSPASGQIFTTRTLAGLRGTSFLGPPTTYTVADLLTNDSTSEQQLSEEVRKEEADHEGG